MHLAHVVRLPRVGAHDPVESPPGRRRALRARARRPAGAWPTCSAETMRARELQRVRVVVGEVVGDAGQPRVHVGAAQFLGGHVLAGRRLHERRAAEEDGAGALHDHRLVRHRGHVRAAGRARAHHDRDLRDARRRHARLVVEDAAEVLAIRKDLGLHRQERAARVHQVDAGQAVLHRDLLGAQVLLHRDRVVGAALHGRVVGDDQHLATRHPADAGDQSSARGLAVVHVRGRQRREFEKRASRGRAAGSSARAPAACPATRWRCTEPARRRPGGPASQRARRSVGHQPGHVGAL